MTKEMQQYQSHKKVSAMNISHIAYIQSEHENATNAPEEDGALLDSNDTLEPVTVSQAYIDKHQPMVGGYYVVYEDGYESFSPPEVFESGYTPIELVENASDKKSLHNTDVNTTKSNVSDLVVFGNGDLFKLLSKASSENEGWMKSTKAMDVVNGCVVQVTTQQTNPDGSYAVAEAITYVPGVRIKMIGDTRVLGAIAK